MESSEGREGDIREERGVGETGATGKQPRSTQRTQCHITSHATFSPKFFPALHGNVDNTGCGCKAL